jgi:hypothetical protein
MRLATTPLQVRLALAYVLQNARKHAAEQGHVLDPDWVDPFSSGRFFDGWTSHRSEPSSALTPVRETRSWLLTHGWRKRGRISTGEIPGGWELASAVV